MTEKRDLIELAIVVAWFVLWIAFARYSYLSGGKRD